MKFLLAFLFACTHFVSGEVVIDENGVLVLDDETFDEAISTYEMLLVEFYAPWCGHCKRLEPEWAKAAKALQDTAKAKLAKVDATIATGLASKFGIKGFPTIKFFKYGKPQEYSGGRTQAEIVSWVNKKSGPATRTLNSVDDFLDFLEINEVFVLGVFSDAESSKVKAFNELASSDENLVYATAFSPEIKNKLALSTDAIVVLKAFDDRRNDFAIDGEMFDIEEVENFIAGSSVPVIQEFTMESSKRIFASPIKKHALFFTNKASDYHKSTMAIMFEVGTQNKGRMLFVHVPSTEDKVIDFFGVTEDSFPFLVVADMSGEGQMKKYPYTGVMEPQAIIEFVNSFFNGDLKPVLKSEEVLPEDTAGDVKILKGKSFADIVLNNNNDVLVEFYAPWCGHCKKLEPTFNALAKQLKPVETLTIAKMDATANEIDVPGVDIRGFPTLYFFKGGSQPKVPEKYDGGRELNDMIKFLSTNAGNYFDHDEL